MSKGGRVEAEEIVAKFGPKGQSFETLVRELVRARNKFEKSGCVGSQDFPDGDTGDILLVRFAQLSLGADNKPINSLFGCRFDNFGFAVVPDNRDWRREISAGRILSFGLLPSGDTRIQKRKRAEIRLQRRKAWKKLQEYSHGK